MSRELFLSTMVFSGGTACHYRSTPVVAVLFICTQCNVLFLKHVPCFVVLFGEAGGLVGLSLCLCVCPVACLAA